MATPATTLINGAKMPLFGFGTWLSEPNVVGQSVKKALEMGYRHIDCAHVYGNEAEVGKVFNEVFTAGNIKREDVFITSKLWVTDFANVKKACELSLKNLQLDYLDLYLIHLPFEADKSKWSFPPTPQGNGIIGYRAERIAEVWKEMEKLVSQGKLKAIGVSNFTTRKLTELLKCPLEIKIACNQVELHPYLPQNSLIRFCEKNNITVEAYSPLGNPGRPDFFKKETDPNLFTDPVVKSIAEKHNATAAQILLAYGLHRKTVVLVKSVNENRIKENLECLKVGLDADDMGALTTLKTRHRYVPQHWALEADQDVPDLWDGEMFG